MSLELFSPGSLGTCWYGRYHYLEPWAGCDHACPYCYARSRGAVHDALADLGTTFEHPRPLLERAELLRRIAEEADSGRIDTVKLCRYTDILTPRFVADGLSYEILAVLARSRVRRLILTTKGVPDERIRRLMLDHKEKFSYNAAARPGRPELAGFDAGLAPLEERLAAAAELNRGGVQTTIHMDPFVAGVDDQDEALLPFLDDLRRFGLNRVMFSYLLLSEPIMASLEEALSPRALQELVDRYDMEASRRVLPRQEDTVSHSLRNEILKESVEKVATVLTEQGFDFVLCSLKSVRGLDARKFPRAMLCDGKFYA